MNRLALTIRTSLLAIVSLLSLSVIVLAGLELAKAWQNFMEARDISESNHTSDLLLSSAGDWAVERGVTNAALAGKDPVQNDTRKAIDARRSRADEAFSQAVKRIAEGPDFKDSDAIVAAVKEAHDRVTVLRAEVDMALRLPLEGRDTGLSERWVSASTVLIMASQRMRLASQYMPDTIETSISLIEDAKGAIWSMSEFAGRERALIGASVSGGLALDTAKLQTLATYRGRVEQAWMEVSAYLEKNGVAPEVLAAAAAVEQTFFGSFENTRQAVYAAGIAGGPYPLDANTWIADATGAIDTLLALARSAGDTADNLATGAAGEARLSMIANGVALALGVTLALAAFWTVVARVIGPIGHITQSMTTLAGGNFSAAIPFTANRNEIGDMARAVEVFKQNGIRVAAMNQEERARNDATAAQAAMLERFNQAFAAVVAAAFEGDFSQRMNLDYDEDMNKFCGTFNSVMASVNGGLTEAGGVLAALAQTDLTHRMSGDYKGAFAQLKADTNAVGDKLTEIVAQLRGTSRSLKTATGEILSGANDLADRTTKQAAAVEETSAAMEQLAGAVTENAQKAEAARDNTRTVSQAADAGGAAMAEANQAMERITNSSSKISNIIGMIDDIAFQTNLLALNASVEAARAGEAGKGFAVVAVEVRRLAQSAAEASDEVKLLIEQSAAEVLGGSRLVAEAAARLATMLEAVRENGRLIDDISRASREQAAAIGEVTVAVRLMDEMTQHNAALVEQTNAAIEQTEAQATELDMIVDIFTVALPAVAARNVPETRPAPGNSRSWPDPVLIRAVRR